MGISRTVCMKKRIMVVLNENQVDILDKNNHLCQPYSKFILQCYLNKVTFNVDSKLRKRAKRRRLYVSINDELVNEITNGNHIVNAIFHKNDR